jgi:serine/threonine-protein kinase
VVAAAAAGGAGAALIEPAVYPEPISNGSGELAQAPSEPEEPSRRNWVPWLWGALVVLLIAGGAATAAYFISRPHQRVIPTVTGDQLNVASKVMQDAGFNVAVIKVLSSKRADTVTGQDPAPGTKAAKASLVTLQVSQGPGNTSVPSVLGLSQGQATRLLRRSSLKVSHVVPESSTQFKSGEATGTNPGVGRSVPVGTSVTLLMSSGQPLANVPNVAGDNQVAATTQLTKAGFNVNPVMQTSSSVAAGNVIRQNPAGGSSETIGSTITIIVAIAPATVTVPPVVGDPVAGAVSALTTAGFRVQRETKDVSQQDQDGTVISQTPAGGSSVNKKSTVTIVVGHYVPSSSSSSSSSSSTTTSSSSTSSSTTTPTTTSASP